MGFLRLIPEPIAQADLVVGRGQVVVDRLRDEREAVFVPLQNGSAGFLKLSLDCELVLDLLAIQQIALDVAPDVFKIPVPSFAVGDGASGALVALVVAKIAIEGDGGLQDGGDVEEV